MNALSDPPKALPAGSAQVIRLRLPENFSLWPESMRKRYLAALSRASGC